MLEEKRFRLIIISVTIFVIFFVFISYFTFYKKQPVLKAENSKTTEEINQTPVNPFEIFSMVKDDLKTKLGKPKKEGDKSDYDNMFLDYSQKWFGNNYDTRYYYGDFDRVYQINIKLDNKSTQKVYEQMKKDLGVNPILDTFFDTSIDDFDERITYFVKDSIRYSLVYDDMIPYIKIKIEYYKNPDKYKIGERPIIISRLDNQKDIVPNEEASILLIGEKNEYTSTYFKNIYVIIGTKTGSYLGRMEKENDGGLNPKITIETINGKKTILVETDNEYTKYYTGFEFKDKKINIVYSSQNKP